MAFPLPGGGHGKRVLCLVILALLAVVNLVAAWDYPPLLLNTIALVALLVVAWRELRLSKQPGE
jgi:hypothetical protein